MFIVNMRVFVLLRTDFERSSSYDRAVDLLRTACLCSERTSCIRPLQGVRHRRIQEVDELQNPIA